MSLGWNEIILLMMVGFAIALLPLIFFCLTEINVLKNIQVHNRVISPGEVWLQMIPLFGMYWQFIVVNRISQSIQNELAGQNNFSFENTNTYGNDVYDTKSLRGTGLTYYILFCCSILPVIGALFGLAGLVCFIIFWVKLSNFKTILQQKRFGLSINTQ